jgi:hypothetical protein
MGAVVPNNRTKNTTKKILTPSDNEFRRDNAGVPFSISTSLFG